MKKKRKTAKRSKLAETVINISRAQDAGLLPDNIIVINMSDKKLQQLFTPKKLELLNFILANNGLTVTQIAGKLGRKKEAISTDLKLLTKYQLVEMPREGRVKRPCSNFKAIQLIPNLTGRQY